MPRALARVNVAAIQRNSSRLAEIAGDAQLCAVVKANGYGHGAVESARAALAGGATWLAVATADEALQLRAAGIEGPLLVMGALDPEELDTAVEADADVVAWTEELVAGLAARGGGRVHVKLDSGMGRFGTRDPEEATRVVQAAEAADGVTLVGLMTHFATADDREDTFFGEQLERFMAWSGPLRDRRPGLLVHGANSAATLREPGARQDLVRCGVALYGMDPFGRDPAEHGLEPAMQLESWVAAVKHAEPGESAGYGRRFVAAAPTTIGTIPVGYSDGVRRGLSSNADVLVRGRRQPLAGTVSMDNITVDLGLDTPVQVGDPAVLIGEQDGTRILVEELAERLQTINYEVTCGISARVPRLHHRDGALP